jgi:tryptophan synthase alpha chain
VTQGGDCIASALAKAAAAGRPAIAAYMTAGYPSRGGLTELLCAVSAACDVVEVGIPFSDPMADGVTIQRSSRIAILDGTTLTFTLEALATSIPSITAPVVLMSYMNPLLAYGVSRVARDAASAGVCGFVVPDLPLEEQALLAPHLLAAGIALIQMVTPTTPESRLKHVCAVSEGFVYAVTVAGTTGGGLADSAQIIRYLQRVRTSTAHPILAGFGVRTRDDVAALVPPADGVVVGSALIDAIDRGESPGTFLSTLLAGFSPSKGAYP